MLFFVCRKPFSSFSGGVSHELPHLISQPHGMYHTANGGLNPVAEKYIKL